MDAVLEKTQAVVLHNISWNSYKQITDALQNETSAHFTFDRGILEIMVLSLKHENLKKILAMLFERLSEILEIEIFAAGSTTFQREDLERGFEPDECYYIQNAALMRGKESVDLGFDPPPDLTIEVDVKHSSLNRMSIFAAIGIPEIWRYDDKKLTIYLLEDNGYRESAESSALPKVKSSELTKLIETGKKAKHKEFLLKIEDYTKNLKG
ncbi:MAG: Uma2 family endonuclease [Acidobacteria bacterium]|nr:Uma2 family endonuclease [Acidobacteriota bacterium]